MAITLTQTDTAAGDGFVDLSNCNANGLNGQTSNKQATAGGTAGITAVTLTHDASALNKKEICFESAAGEPNNASWQSGNWTFRLEVTTSNMNLSWANIVIGMSTTPTTQCYASSGISIALGTTGVKTSGPTNLTNGGSQVVSDRIVVLYEIVSSAGSMTQTWAYKPSQNIDTPVTQGTAAAATVGPLLAQQQNHLIVHQGWA